MSGLPFPKQSESVYQKHLSSKNLLQNLRTYNLIAGNVNPSTVKSLRDKYRGDEGRALGSLIKGQLKEENTSTTTTNSSSRRNLKRKRNQDKLWHKTRRKMKAKDEEDEVNKPIGLVANYHSDNSSDSDHGDGDHNDGDHGDGRLLHIPQAILDLYKSEEEKKTSNPVVIPIIPEPPTLDSDSDSNGLGYFANETDSCTSDNEPVNDTSFPVLNDKWKKPSLALSTYECGKCGKIGHLSKHCTVGKEKIKISSHLRRLFAICKNIKMSSENKFCAACGSHGNLVHCLDCKAIFCDGRGHISQHLFDHPSHKNLYSYKLTKLIKCCKVDCSVTDVYKLLMCSFCLSKAFSQYYSMITATWSDKGLRVIANALCCEEHFQWHVINCTNTAEEHLVSPSRLNQSMSSGLLSEFFF